MASSGQQFVSSSYYHRLLTRLENQYYNPLYSFLHRRTYPTYNWSSYNGFPLCMRTTSYFGYIHDYIHILQYKLPKTSSPSEIAITKLDFFVHPSPTSHSRHQHTPLALRSKSPILSIQPTVSARQSYTKPEPFYFLIFFVVLLRNI